MEADAVNLHMLAPMHIQQHTPSPPPVLPSPAAQINTQSSAIIYYQPGVIHNNSTKLFSGQIIAV